MKFDRYWPLIKSVCACIIGAGVAAFGFILSVAIAGVGDDIGDPQQIPKILAFVFSMSALIPFALVFACTALPMLIIGLPVQALLQKYHQTSYWVHAIFSVVGGSLASLFLFPSLPLAGFCAAIGFAAGSVAWLIRRPDKDALPAKAAHG
ncbi:hypothetical protein [Asticcacaulis sp.]|uniref:hypothetical protein n=1 Tax=Asticcacaulis sp. TaxID=1872648 RepID=UPI0026338B49|nr:hypothetical protein [Asticcacaulis sp.]